MSTTLPASAPAAPLMGAAFVRAATRGLHERAEAVTGLPGSLRDRRDVRGLLHRWRGLAVVLEPRAGGLVATLVPVLDADLARLGQVAPTDRAAGALPTDGVAEAPGLGVAYVLLGARLGLRHIADHAEGLAGHRLGAMRATDPIGLRDVKRRLDGLTGVELAHATAAARSAFEVAITELGGPPWQP